jgi:hypothetical protein
VCSMGRAGGGARAAPVSATGRRAGGRFDVDRVGGHDKMHRTHPPAVAQARILPSGPAPHPGGRERVSICSSACFQSPDGCARTASLSGSQVSAPVSTALVLL